MRVDTSRNVFADIYVTYTLNVDPDVYALYTLARRSVCVLIFHFVVCQLPRDPGPCTARHTKFYFDTETRRCVEFTYGGCQGNANKFSTQSECERTCNELLVHKQIGKYVRFRSLHSFLFINTKIFHTKIGCRLMYSMPYSTESRCNNNWVICYQIGADSLRIQGDVSLTCSAGTSMIQMAFANSSSMVVAKETAIDLIRKLNVDRAVVRTLVLVRIERLAFVVLLNGTRKEI